MNTVPAAGRRYTGRFAPTPSGPLHFGSLIAAVASFLDARRNNGLWLLRIDDIDTPRLRGGAAEQILHSLEKLGLYWDGDVVFQSRHLAEYEAALESLMDQGLLYRCDCPRRLVKGRPYPGTCRERGLPPSTERFALRVVTGREPVGVHDLIQGDYFRQPAQETGDFIVHRADGITAYHLAAAVDDARQGVTRVVRGADLLPSTPPQVYLQQCLGLATPAYAHFPVAVDADGRKISKSEQAPAADVAANPGGVLFSTLAFLGQNPPAELDSAHVTEILDWAVQNWDLASIPKRMEITLPQS